MDSKRNKRIIVLGGNGFIGSSLLSFFLKRGDYDLVSISRGKFSMNGVKALQGNFSNKKFLKKAFKQGDIVVHSACTTVPVTSENNKKKDYIQNVLGTKNMLRVCVDKKISMVVFMSSGGTVYGDYGQKKVSETDSTKPVSYHGKMKLEIEKIIQDYSRKHNLQFLIIRASNAFGRNRAQQNDIQGVIEAFLSQAAKSGKIVIWGDGEQVRDFIYIDDLVRAIQLLIESGAKNEIINIGSGKGMTVNQIADWVQKSVKARVDIKHSPSRSFDVLYNVLSIVKVRKMIDWRLEVSVKEGIRKLAKNYYR